MKWIVLILFFAALTADVYIYRSVVCTYFRKLPPRIAYILYAILTDCTAFAAFFLYGYVAGLGTDVVAATMWLVWVFLFTALPKLLFTLGGFIDYLISLMVRRRILIFRPVALALSVAGAALMIYGATAGRAKIRVNEVGISSERIPKAFDGYRIVQFSDLHAGTMLNADPRVARMVETINGLGADMVVSTGDLVHISYADLTPGIMSELSRIEAPDGVWSVWGNHDLGFYIKDTTGITPGMHIAELGERKRRMGWKILADESVYIRRGGDSILLSGINYPDDGRLNGHNSTLSGADIDAAFSEVKGDPYSVALSHAPQMWREITAAGFGDLTLAGHVHSMQFKFRLFGRQWSFAKYLHPEWSGLYEEKNKQLYINDGIGCVGYPMRIGAAPELTLFILKRCE